MKKWVRFEAQGKAGFGCLADNQINEYSGDLFGECAPTGNAHLLSDVQLLSPCQPGKIIALWNNFYKRAAVQGHEIPEGLYYFMKPPSSVIGPGTAIQPPTSYNGGIVYEGELGIVIARSCKNVDEKDALSFVKGYTCVNDVTGQRLIKEKKAFEQWTRAKGFDTFGVLGPCIAEIADPTDLIVKTRVNGEERQNYAVADMIFSPAQIVSLLSKDMTLETGDVIACGTCLGSKPMDANSDVEVDIAGIGILQNIFNPL